MTDDWFYDMYLNRRATMREVLERAYSVVFEYESDDTLTIPAAITDCHTMLAMTAAPGKLKWYVGVHSEADAILFKLAQR